MAHLVFRPLLINELGEIVCVSVRSPDRIVVLADSPDVVACCPASDLEFELNGGAIDECGASERLKSDIETPDSSRCFNRLNLPSISFAV